MTAAFQPRFAFIQGASRGIGLAFVENLLAQPQVECVLASSRQPAESSGLQALRQQYGDRLQLIPLNLADDQAIAAAAEKAAAIVPRLDLLVNASGFLHGNGLAPEKRLAQVSRELLLQTFTTNTFGPILMVQALEPLFKHKEPAVLANISARVGSIGDNQLGGWYSYRASKSALNMLTRTLALEWQRRHPNAIVVALHPGITATDLSAPFQANVPPEKLFSPDRTVRQLLAVISGLTAADSGQFFAWDGSPIPW